MYLAKEKKLCAIFTVENEPTEATESFYMNHGGHLTRNHLVSVKLTTSEKQYALRFGSHSLRKMPKNFFPLFSIFERVKLHETRVSFTQARDA